jgi:hypothetical protein
MWEVERFDWAALKASGSAVGVPAAIQRLTEAQDQSTAEAAYWAIDNTVVVQGALYEAALPAVSCLLAALQRSTPTGRPYILELLAQICGGTPIVWDQESARSLEEDCLEELGRGVSTFFDLLEHGTSDERCHAVDLLTICCLNDPSLRQRCLWYLEKVLAGEPDSSDLGRLVKNCIARFSKL